MSDDQSNLSKEEFLALLGAEPAVDDLAVKAGETLGLPSIKSTSNKPTRRPKFTNKQYALFSLPVSVVYLKGMLPALRDSATLEEALAHSLVRSQGSVRHSEFASAMTSHLKVHKDGLYQSSSKASQVELINLCIDEGLAVNYSKCMSRAAAQEALDQYLKDRSEHLAELGFDSIEAYNHGIHKVEAGIITTPITLDDLDW